MGLKYSISAFVTTGLTCESWVKLGRNRLETKIKSIFHSPESTRAMLKEKNKWDIKICFCFWAWPFIPLSHYTEVNGLDLLPQEQFKLLLVKKNPLSCMLFLWGVQRKASRGKTPTDHVAWLGVAAVPGQFQSPSPCLGQDTAGLCHPKHLSPGQGQPEPHTSSVGRRTWEHCSQQNHASSSWKAPREGFRADPSLFAKGQPLFTFQSGRDISLLEISSCSVIFFSSFRAFLIFPSFPPFPLQ